MQRLTMQGVVSSPASPHGASFAWSRSAGGPELSGWKIEQSGDLPQRPLREAGPARRVQAPEGAGEETDTFGAPIPRLVSRVSSVVSRELSCRSRTRHASQGSRYKVFRHGTNGDDSDARQATGLAHYRIPGHVPMGSGILYLPGHFRSANRALDCMASHPSGRSSRTLRNHLRASFVLARTSAASPK